MHKKTFLTAILAIGLIFLFSVAANAQGGASYQFLEVLDSFGKPVAEAKVDSDGCFPPTQLTNQKGQLERGFPVCYGDYQTRGMSVSKAGYFPFEDLGLFRGPYAFNRQDEFRIELLKIPQNETERRAIGNEQQKRELILAVTRGQADEVKRLLKSGISPNLNTNDLRGIPGPKNIPAIIYAADLAETNVIKEFLAAGADIKSKNSPARDILLRFLKSRSNLARYDYFSRPSEEKRLNALQLYEQGFDALIKAGADIHVADDNGDTALTIAISHGFKEISQKLLALDYTSKEKSQTLRRLIFLEDEKDPASLENIRLLLKAGADPNYVVNDVNDYTHNDCSTLLMLAGNMEKLDFVKILLAEKANINFKCKNGKTALISALEQSKPETARMLLKAGASVQGTGNGIKTALMVAAERNYFDIAETLIAKGVPVNVRAFMSDTAFDLAIEKKASKEMLELLLKSGTNPNGQSEPYCHIPIQAAGSYGNLEAIRLLVAYKADINAKCGIWSALVSAAKSGHTDAVKLLLENGADIKGESGQRAMNFVKENLKSEYPYVKARAEEIYKLLVDAGVKETPEN